VSFQQVAGLSDEKSGGEADPGFSFQSIRATLAQAVARAI
jgi:hypothetical protein